MADRLQTGKHEMTEQADHTPEQGRVPAPPIEDASTVQNAATSPAAPAPAYPQQPPMQPPMQGYPQQPPMQGYPQQAPMQGYPQQAPMQGYPPAQVYAQQPIYVQTPMMGMAQPGLDKSVGVAYLLLIFLGLFGAHQFYLDKIGRGVGYFFTLGWLTVGLWIDLFTLTSQVRAINTQRRMGIR